MNFLNLLPAVVLHDPLAFIEFCAAFFTAVYVARLACGSSRERSISGVQTSPVVLAIPLRGGRLAQTSSVTKSRSAFAAVGALISLPKQSLRWQSPRSFRRA